MTRQCLVATTMHQPGVKSSASAERGLQQSRILVLSMDAMSNGAKCEELEKITIDDDSEKFFQIGAQLPPREKQELIVFL